MVSATAPRRMTLEDWAALPEDEGGELVDGLLTEEEVPDLIHETVARWLLFLLHRHFAARGGLAVGSGLKLGIAPGRGRLGDVVAYSAERRPPARGVVRVPPDVLVEVVSPSPTDERRDRVQKPDDYAAFGIKWYWLVDPALRSFEIWELGSDARYVRALAVESGLLERVPGCEGLVVDVDAMWAEVDALPQD